MPAVETWRPSSESKRMANWHLDGENLRPTSLAAVRSLSSAAMKILPAAVIDSTTLYVLVTNLGSQSHSLPQGFKLGEAVPLGPDDLSTRASNFHMHPSVDPPPTPADVASAFLASDKELSAEPLDFNDDELARPQHNAVFRSPSCTRILSPLTSLSSFEMLHAPPPIRNALPTIQQRSKDSTTFTKRFQAFHLPRTHS